MLALDTNILLDAANTRARYHDVCRRRLDAWREEATPVFLTWNVCYEFLRVSTHPRVFRPPWQARDALRFIEGLLASPGVALLTATERHAAILAQTLSEIPDLRGKVLHDVHTAVLMREHGVDRICTRDADFRRFPFLTVVDPLA